MKRIQKEQGFKQVGHLISVEFPAPDTFCKRFKQNSVAKILFSAKVFFMKPTVLAALCGVMSALVVPALRADQLQMQNGDRYTGKVLSVSADTVVLQNEILGKINLPRAKVTSMAFGTNAVASALVPSGEIAGVSVPTNLPNAAALSALTNTKTNLSATVPNLSSNADIARQIREQMLAGSPEATGKYNELIGGLMSGKLNVNDIRREAKSSADELRKLKKDLGPEVGDSLDGYLEILDNFLNETSPAKTNAVPGVRTKPGTR